MLQHWGTEIAVRADRADITSPKDLDGKIYGGFGGPSEEPKMRAVIQRRGRARRVHHGVLGTSAYEALYAGEVDFTEPFVAWEGIEARAARRAAAARSPTPTTASRTPTASADRQLALAGRAPRRRPRRSCRPPSAATSSAADDPARAAQLLEDANPGAFTEPELVARSQADAERALPARRGGPGRPADAGAVVGLLRLPVRRRRAGRPGRRAARPPGRTSRPGSPTQYLRLTAVTTPRRPGRRPRSGRARPRGWAWLRRAAPPLVLVAVGLAVWQWYVTASGVRPQVLPSPLRVVEQGWAFRDQLWANTLPTLQVTAVGFAVSLAVGWALAVAVDFSPWLRRALTPLLVASQTLPIIAIAPLLIIWFGFGLLPKVVVIALVTFFPIAVGLIEGFAAHRPPGHQPAAQHGRLALGSSSGTCGCPGRCRRSSPRCASASPTPSPARSSPSTSGATAGLGIFMNLQKNSFRTDLVLAAVLVTAADLGHAVRADLPGAAAGRPRGAVAWLSTKLVIDGPAQGPSGRCRCSTASTSTSRPASSWR